MYTNAYVRKINPDKTIIAGCDAQACSGCKAQFFCNNKDENQYMAANPKSIEVSEGDWVELFLPPGKTIGATVLVFALPLALFPAGYFLFRTLFSHATELTWALGGFGAMAVAFAISSVVFSRHKRKLMPILERILAPVAKEEEK